MLYEVIATLKFLFSIKFFNLTASFFASWIFVFLHIIINSSPPHLAKISFIRRFLLISLVNAISVKSPIWWPYVSLTFLKWSISIKSKDKWSLYLFLFSTSFKNNSSNLCLLYILVKWSWYAKYSYNFV